MGKYDRFGIKAFTWGTEDMLKSKENSIDFAANRIAMHLKKRLRMCVKNIERLVNLFYE